MAWHCVGSIMARTKRPAVMLRVVNLEELRNASKCVQTGVQARRKSPDGKARNARTAQVDVMHITPRQGAAWRGKLEEAERWVRRRGRFPKQSTSDKAEKALYTWLRHNLQRSRGKCPERWKLLNETFGEGWERVFSPGFGEGQGITRAIAAQWDRTLAHAQGWVVEHGGYPKDNKLSGKVERYLYRWLENQLPGRSRFHAHRWVKLNEAFGTGWEKDFSPTLRLCCIDA